MVIGQWANGQQERELTLTWGLRRHTPGIYRFPARMVRPAEQYRLLRIIPAAGPALRSHPCGAVSSAQVEREYQSCVAGSSGLHASILHVLWAGVYEQASDRLVRRTQHRTEAHTAGATDAECLRREFQRAPARRMPECVLVPEHGRRAQKDRTVEARIQRRTAPQRSCVPNSGRVFTSLLGAGSEGGLNAISDRPAGFELSRRSAPKSACGSKEETSPLSRFPAGESRGGRVPPTPR